MIEVQLNAHLDADFDLAIRDGLFTAKLKSFRLTRDEAICVRDSITELLGQEEGATVERLLNVARGAHLCFGGGYANEKESAIFHQGIETVIQALQAAVKNKPKDYRTAVLEDTGKRIEKEKTRE